MLPAVSRALKQKIMATIHLNKSEFAQKVADPAGYPTAWKFVGGRPAVIDFYAPWCGPCRALSPVLEELSDEYAGKVDIYKVDVDENPELAAAFGIRSIPTLLFAAGEGKPRISVGGMSKSQLEGVIAELLKA